MSSSARKPLAPGEGSTRSLKEFDGSEENSADSDDDSEQDQNSSLDEPDDSPGAKSLRKSRIEKNLQTMRWPIVASIFIELMWCASLTSWMLANDIRYSSKATEIQVQADAAGQNADKLLLMGLASDHFHVVSKSWFVFVACLLLRILLVVSWKSMRLPRVKDSTYASLYMACSTFQWVLYANFYYSLFESLTDVKGTPKLMVKAAEVGTADLVSNATNLTGAFGESLSMVDCLQKFSPTMCVGKVNQFMVCQQAFNFSTCSGWSYVGNQSSVVKCCVRNMYTLTRPNDTIPPTNLSMKVVASFLLVLSTLAIWWVVRNNPMMPFWADASDFTSGVWLDIIDAVTFGQSYSTDVSLLELKYGIDDDALAVEQNPWPWFHLMIVSIVALSTAILSPVLYTFFLSKDYGEEDEEDRTADQAIADATQRVRALDKEGAQAGMVEACDLQRQQYAAEAIGGGVSDSLDVTVWRDDDSAHSTPSSKSLSRPGKAEHIGNGLFRVRYTDGKLLDEEEVPVERLSPDMRTSHGWSGERCCSGWLHPSRLWEQEGRARFETRAAFLDAVRSFVCLEAPFLYWRWRLEHKSLDMFSFAWILMLKNFVWGLHDLLIIFGCGSATATCFGHTPARSLQRLASNTVLERTMVMGEGGIVLIGHQLLSKAVSDRLESKSREVSIHKAWLIVERAKAAESGDDKAVERFGKNIDHLEAIASDIELKKGIRVA